METKEPDSRLSVRTEDLKDKELYRLNQVINDLYSKLAAVRDEAASSGAKKFVRSGVKDTDRGAPPSSVPPPPGGVGSEYFIRFVDESGSIAAGLDVGSTWGRIDCSVGNSVKIREIGVVAKTAPVGSSFISDVLYSPDSGLTWLSLFPLGNTNKLILPSGSRVATNSNFAVSILAHNSLLRVDYIQVGAAIRGGGIVITLNGEII